MRHERSRRLGSVTAIVLAAGSSSRFGRPKQLAALRGKPLLRHAVEVAASSAADEVVVVLGHSAEAVRPAISPLPERVRVVVNASYRRGQATSLDAGLRASGDDVIAAVVVLGDAPGTDGSVIDAAIEAWHEGERPIVRSLYRDGPGHPVVLGRDVWHLLDKGDDVGARALFARRPELVSLLHVDANSPLDVDRGSDLAVLERHSLDRSGRVT